MFKGQVIYKGITYELSPNYLEIIRKDEELDEFNCVIRGLTEAQVDLFEAGEVIDFEVYEDGTRVRRVRYIIANINPQKITRSGAIYQIEITGVEYTVKMQREVVHGQAFTQPNDRSLTRYTASKILEKLFYDSRLFQDGSYFIPTATKDVLDFKSADFAWKDNTFFECVAELFGQIDAVPRLQYNYTFDDDDVIVDKLNEKGNHIDVYTNSRNQETKQDIEDKVDFINRRLENVLDTSPNNITIYPSEEGFVSLKSEALYLDKNKFAHIPTGQKKIYDLLEVRVLASSIVTQEDGFLFNITYDNGVDVPSTRSVSYTSFVDNIEAGYSVDMTPNIFEKNAFETLIVQSGAYLYPGPTGSNAAIGNPEFTRANCLYYEQYKPNIVGIDFDSREVYQTDTDTMNNAIGSSLARDPVILQAAFERFAELEGLTNPSPLDFTFNFLLQGQPVPNAEQFAQLEFNTTFVSSDDFVARTEKIDSLNTTSNLYATKIINQENRKIDIKRSGFADLGLIQRIGVKENNVVQIHKSYSDIFNVSDFDDTFIIHTATYVYNNTSIEGTYKLSKDFNRLSNRRQVNSEIRTTNISQEDFVDRLNTKREYLTLEQDTNASRTRLLSSSAIKPLFFNGFFTSATNTRPSMAYTTIRIGFDFDGSTKYTEIDTEGNFEGKGSALFLQNLSTRVHGRTMYFISTTETNATNGKRLLSNRDVEDIPYVYLGENELYQGEVDVTYYSIGYGTDIPGLFASSIPLVLISDDNTIFNPSGIIDEPVIEVISGDTTLVFKDRGERIIEQFEIDTKVNDLNLIVFPEFLSSHRLMGGSGLYRMAKVSREITLADNNLSVLGDDVTEFNLGVAYNASTGRINVTNDGEKYVIYNANTLEVLIANNKPVNTTGDNYLYIGIVDDLDDAFQN